MSVTKKLNIPVQSRNGKAMLTDLFYKDDAQTKPVIVFAHGFKGFKDWGCWDLIAERCAAEGFAFIKFNFSNNGTTAGKPTEFADLEAFGNNNFTTQLDDLDAILDWVENDERVKSISNGDIILIGHSLGGGLSIIKAREDKRISKLVTWAAISWFDRLFPEDIDAWEQEGVHYTLNARTGQEMPLYYQLAEDYYENEERLDILDACIRIRVPFLVVHGTHDEAVPVQMAFLLKRYAGDAELILLDGAGHTFGAKHPFEGNELPAESEALVQQTVAFLKS